MKIYKYPKRSIWDSMIERQSLDKSSLDTTVNDILKNVKTRGDDAVMDYNRMFDGFDQENLIVSADEILEASSTINDDLKNAIRIASGNISKYHEAQKDIVQITETSPGVLCWRESRPIEKVGLYIPGGSAPLFSSILMLAIPAMLAGCEEVILCTPPDNKGEISPAILYAASTCGIRQIFKVGGAQAIGAMAYGTESIPSVFKIFGPGNQYVTRAKELVQLEGTAIDIPAGPSEVLVIADKESNPDFVAADLLSQAEHGSDSQALLLSDSEKLITETVKSLNKQLKELPRKDIASKSLEISHAILLDDIEKCIEFSNLYAPEHLILALSNSRSKIKNIKSAGSVFLGAYSCESAGDYASGTNHTLPTNGAARSYSGVSLDSFVKKISFQEINQTGLQAIGKSIEDMADAEGLFAHKNAVSIRLKTIYDV